MKALLLLLTCAISINAFAADCSKVPHAIIPSKHLSLYDKKTDNFKDYSVVRNVLMKNGWKPQQAQSIGVSGEYPEEYCIVDRCIYTYVDKYNNKLSIEKQDDISSVTTICK